jgi:hypothetical protein
MVTVLGAARRLERPGVDLRRLIYVGDTRMNDGTAFANLCRAGGWPGVAFIGADRGASPRVDVVEEGAQTLYLANRWAALADFDAFLRRREFPIDEATAVVLDLDKTTLGARGRNDQVINAVRVEAVRRTVGDLLGRRFDDARFEAAYRRLNRVEFHPFTADNQDYLAYICLILGTELYDLDALTAEVRAGRMTTFSQFITRVDEEAGALPTRLAALHRRIYARVRAGDPTPFKAFRYNEYRVTVERLGCASDAAPVAELLAGEIVITQEVRRAALAWRARGALLFGLSDKPDEASLPSEVLAAQGYRPIHRAESHAVGEEGVGDVEDGGG